MLNEFSFDSFYIRHAIDDMPNDSEFTMHIHEQCEIYFFVDGNINYLVEGSKYELSKNNIIIMRPSESHKAKILSEDRYERYAINFPVEMFSEIDPKGQLLEAFLNRPLGKNNLYTSDEIDVELIKTFLAQMCENEDEYLKKLTIRTHMPIILDMLYRAFKMRGAIHNKNVTVEEKMVAYINKHLTDDISIPALAKHFYLSESQLSRVFKKATGSSPWEYIVRKRLALVREKVRAGAIIQKASEECGFSDYSSFYRAYVKYIGESPRDAVIKK